ncbi:hypothetical protein ACHQM5_000969 [Ranunculus cassubicifolius]
MNIKTVLWSLALRGCKRDGRSFLANRSAQVNKNEALIRPFMLYKENSSLYSTCIQKFSSQSSRNTMAQYAQVAWKRFLQRRYNLSAFSPMAKIVCITGIFCATGITLSQSNTSGLKFLKFFAFKQSECQDQNKFLKDFASKQPVNQHSQYAHTLSISTVWDHFSLCMRAMYLAILFSPAFAMAPFTDLFGLRYRETWIHLVRITFEKAGPAFIALGQWAATRPDLFPRDLCAELSKLHSKFLEHKFAHTKETIEKAFGRKLPEIFDNFEEVPVELGSVAQVHRATLRYRYPGKQANPILVAVKVRHPDIMESFKTDYVIIHSFVKLLNFIPTFAWLKLDQRLQQFGELMASKVDLSKEATLLARFSHNFSGWSDVFFRLPIYPLVHPAVSVEAYQKGERVSRYIDDENMLATRTKDDIIFAGTRALLNMFVVDKFIHAGMHPESVLVRINKGDPRVIFLDVGMTATISIPERIQLAKLVQAAGTRDGRIAAECALRLSKSQDCPSPDAFIEDVEKSFAFWDTREGGMISPLECMNRLLEKVRAHKVNIDDNVCTVMASIMALEVGFGCSAVLTCNPDIINTVLVLLIKNGIPLSLSLPSKMIHSLFLTAVLSPRNMSKHPWCFSFSLILFRSYLY